MNKFLAIQHTYQGIELALFQDSRLLEKVYDDKKRASKNFIHLLTSLLKNNTCTLEDISFIAANKGPGPFTTLRVVLASVNGLGFATKKPLIGIDGLMALLQEYQDDKHSFTVALLDAFSGDVYFGIEAAGLSDRYIGYKNNVLLLEELYALYLDAQCPEAKIQFVGNGAIKYKSEIHAMFGNNAIFLDPIPEHCSIEQIGKLAFKQWNHSEGLSDQLLPMYLKQMAFKKPEKPSSF